VGVDTDQLQRTLCDRIDIELFGGHADDGTAFVIVKRNAVALHQPKFGGAGHHEMGGGIIVLVITRIGPFERLDRRRAIFRNGNP
jgi:hypothetical protein